MLHHHTTLTCSSHACNSYNLEMYRFWMQINITCCSITTHKHVRLSPALHNQCLHNKLLAERKRKLMIVYFQPGTPAKGTLTTRQGLEKQSQTDRWNTISFFLFWKKLLYFSTNWNSIKRGNWFRKYLLNRKECVRIINTISLSIGFKKNQNITTFGLIFVTCWGSERNESSPIHPLILVDFLIQI